MVKKNFRLIPDQNEELDPILVEKKYMDCEKYVYTFIICFIHLSFGITYSTIGPALVDLKYILDTQMDKISLIIIFQSGGLMVGSLFGVLYNYLNRQLLLTALLSTMSISCLLIPYSQRLWHLYLYNWIFGFGAGAWINAKNVWTIELWHHKSAPILQLSGLMYGIGSILGPLIDDPYLTGHITPTINSTIVINKTLIEENRLHNIRSPFLISASIQMIGPVLLIIMFFLRKYEKFEQKYEQIFDEIEVRRKDSVKRHKHLKAALIGLVSLFLAFHMSSEQNVQQFGSTYLQDIKLKLTASQSAEVMSAMFFANTLGLAISVLIATRVRSQFMIGYHLLIIFIALNVLFLVEYSKLQLYIGSLLLSFGFSAIYPSMFGFISQYLDITDKIGTIFMIASGSLNLFVPFLIGLYIEEFTPIFLLSIAFNLAISIFVYIFLIQLINKYCN